MMKLGVTRLSHDMVAKVTTWEYIPTLKDRIIHAASVTVGGGIFGGLVIIAMVLAPQAFIASFMISLIFALAGARR